MNFDLSEEQVLLRDTVRKMAVQEFAPLAAHIDEHAEFPWKNKELLKEYGLLGVHIPQEFGGAGAGMLSMAIVVEEIARVCAATSVILTTQALATDPLLLGGSERQKHDWLTPMAEGDSLGACAITEPGAGSDVLSIRTTAIKDSKGYVLNGRKIFITNSGVADYITVVAYTNKELGHKGISLFMVPRDTPGLTIGKQEPKMGIRGSDTHEVIFEDCRAPKGNLIGQEGAGFYILMNTFNYTRPLVAAQALGIAQGAFDLAISYTKERIQFGKGLFEFQGVQWMLAEMALKVELARTLIWRVCSMIDRHPKSKEIKRLASMAKWHASDVAMSVTTDAVQLLGGYGYSREFPLERMMRDAKITQIYEGTNQIQRNIVSADLLR